MEIAIGQTWVCRNEMLAEVIEETVQGWIIKTGQDTRIKLDRRGRKYGDDLASAWDLLTLIPVPGPNDERCGLAQPTKLSNPKEVMGDKKVPLWLCSTIATAHWAAAQVAGYVKYGAWNWRAAGVRASTYLSAMGRHLGRYTNGERLDPVDGTHHLGNIMACCAILLEAEALGKLNDDRPPKADAALAKALEEVEQICAKLKVQYADKTPKHWTIDDTTEGNS